jgi:hypothetical protein
MYACLTNECVLMPTTCLQQARGCTLHYYGLTPDVDSDVDCVNQCIAYWTLTRGMHKGSPRTALSKTNTLRFAMRRTAWEDRRLENFGAGIIHSNSQPTTQFPQLKEDRF